MFMGFSRQEYWSGLPFPSPVDHILSDLSTMTCPSWVAPGAWLSFIELDKAVVLVWLDWLVFCPLMPSCNTYSYLGRGVYLHGYSSKAQQLLLTLEEGYFLTAALPDLQRWIAPLGPPAPPRSHGSLDMGLVLPATTPGLGRGVAPIPSKFCWQASCFLL